jgi:transaldolase
VAKTTIQQLNDYGQSVWLDYISRSLLDTGQLSELIEQGVSGMTSNPTIFDKAVSQSEDYDANILRLKAAKKTTFEIYDDITVNDIQDACDRFVPTYKATDGVDGYVSLEINPKLAHDPERTVAEGKRLYDKVDRPNVMFKVPSTDAGFPAITALIAEGMNINVTLIFSLKQYVSTVEAYLQGIYSLLSRGGDARRVRSVASVFVSRVDTLTDRLIDERLAKESDAKIRAELEVLKGQAARANSTMIFNEYEEMFSGDQFISLKKQGGNVQRLLWGSTSTKNPLYSDTKYVTELIGKNTVNTIPEPTLRAFLDHGVVKEALPGDMASAQATLDRLRKYNISIEDVCQKLLEDGVLAFKESFDSLLRSIEEKASRL